MGKAQPLRTPLAPRPSCRSCFHSSLSPFPSSHLVHDIAINVCHAGRGGGGTAPLSLPPPPISLQPGEQMLFLPIWGAPQDGSQSAGVLCCRRRGGRCAGRVGASLMSGCREGVCVVLPCGRRAAGGGGRDKWVVSAGNTSVGCSSPSFSFYLSLSLSLSLLLFSNYLFLLLFFLWFCGVSSLRAQNPLLRVSFDVYCALRSVGRGGQAKQCERRKKKKRKKETKSHPFCYPPPKKYTYTYMPLYFI